MFGSRGAHKKVYKKVEERVKCQGLEDAHEELLEDIVAAFDNKTIREEQLNRLVAKWLKRDENRADMLVKDAPSHNTLKNGGSNNGLFSDREDQRRFQEAHTLVDSVPVELVEADGTPIVAYKQKDFKNWGHNVEFKPDWTFVPKTVKGIQNIILWANQNKKKVRAVGYRHTWANLYQAGGNVLISLLDLKTATRLPAPHPKLEYGNPELQFIRGPIPIPGVDDKVLVEVGAGTTNEHFRKWVLDRHNEGISAWTIPLNVVMVEITFGGSNAPICHGGGLRHQTISDLVKAIEFVNVKGEVQRVDDPEQLKAAAGCFGLLGVVTKITLILDRLTFAKLRPIGIPLALAIPPPTNDYVLPTKVQEQMNKLGLAEITDEQHNEAVTKFVHRCETEYYSEWFWFILQPTAWVNTWSDGADKANIAVDYPSPIMTKIQQTELYIMHLANTYVFSHLKPSVQAKLICGGAQKALPNIQEDEDPIVTPTIDALHFARGIQNMRCRDMEWEIPIPEGKDGKADWRVCQEAWWMVIKAVYDEYDIDNKLPCRLVMEMRIMGGSDMIMAPQAGNKHGTCSIEILTPNNVDETEFKIFMQKITDDWLAIKDIHGAHLRSRPHWAKQWEGLKVRGQDIKEYMMEIYQDAIPKFVTELHHVAQAGGFSLTNSVDVFGNDNLDYFFRDEIQEQENNQQ